MFAALCDDDKYIIEELKKLLLTYAKENRIIIDIDEFVVQDSPIVNTKKTNIATGIILAISGYPKNSTNVSLLTNNFAIDAATNKTIPNAVFIT